MNSKATKEKNCTKGYSCGATCISLAVRCRDALAKGPQQLLENYSAIARLNKKASPKFNKLAEYINSGKMTGEELQGTLALMRTMHELPKADRTGVKSIEIDQAEALFETERFNKYAEAYDASWDDDGKFNPTRPGGMKDYIDSNVKQGAISDELVDVIWGTLPRSFKTTFQNAGSPRAGGYWTRQFEEDVLTPVKTANGGNSDRGKDTLKRYMEQKGISPYTGQFVHVKDAEGEHLVPEELSGKRGDQKNNFAWISAAENKWHDKLDPAQWKAMAQKNVLDRKDAYAKDLAKKKEESVKSKGKQGKIDGQIAELNSLAEPKARQEAMRGIAEGLKAKSYKLLEASGMNKTFRTPYPTKLKDVVEDYQAGKTVKIPYRREIPDKDSTIVKEAYADKYGKQNPTSLLFQALAFAPEKAEALKAGFEKLSADRQIDLDDAMKLYIDAGNSDQPVKDAIASKSKEFGQGFRTLLEDLVPGFESN